MTTLFNSKQLFAGKEMYVALFVSLVVLAATVIMNDVTTSMNVTGILQQLGIAHPPGWLVWTLLGAGAVSVVVATLTTFGLATVPVWASSALIAADSAAV